MPEIPEMLIETSEVVAEELYNRSLFNPDVATSFEILNGRLDKENYGGGNKSVPPYACQFGSFAAGFYFGFDKDEFVYAEQIGGNREVEGTISTSKFDRIVSAGLSADMWLPFDASFVLFGIQAFFKQDAIAFIKVSGIDDLGDNAAKTEYWSLKVYFDDDQLSGMYASIPHSKVSGLDEGNPSFSTLTSDPDFDAEHWIDSEVVGVTDSVLDYGYGRESRYRFASKVAAKTNVSKGYHSITTSFFAGVADGNQGGAKLVIPTGGIWALAFR
tara:strand:- start:6998 stop:7813 length:816 start_codon:yes stop_codon:yes gene_type:complete